MRRLNVDITWHQHLPSNSLDLLELPQGPALLSACLDWGLPRVAHLQLLAALLAEAPERFPKEQHAFVGELLLAAAAVDRSRSDWLVAGLAAAAQQLHDHLPPGHPARRLYATLRDQAHVEIATADVADRALVEE
jgi:hypothetical protein